MGFLSIKRSKRLATTLIHTHMKKKIQKYLEITTFEPRITALEKDTRIEHLESELRRAIKYIGALYDYLEVRPKRTFVQDYSQLPQEQFPTMEVIKVETIKRKK